jgi:hypothetical protein
MAFSATSRVMSGSGSPAPGLAGAEIGEPEDDRDRTEEDLEEAENVDGPGLWGDDG